MKVIFYFNTIYLAVTMLAYVASNYMLSRTLKLVMQSETLKKIDITLFSTNITGYGQYKVFNPTFIMLALCIVINIVLFFYLTVAKK